MVTLALIASTVIAIIGWHARPDNNSGNVARSASNGSVVKAGKAIQITTRGNSRSAKFEPAALRVTAQRIASELGLFYQCSSTRSYAP